MNTALPHTLGSTLDHALIIPVGSQTVQFSEFDRGERWTLKSKARGESKDARWDYTSIELDRHRGYGLLVENGQ